MHPKWIADYFQDKQGDDDYSITNNKHQIKKTSVLREVFYLLPESIYFMADSFPGLQQLLL